MIFTWITAVSIGGSWASSLRKRICVLGTPSVFWLPAGNTQVINNILW